MKAVFATVMWATLWFCNRSQEVNGSLVANGKSAVLKYAVAQEVDSALEKGYIGMMIVVLLNGQLGPADARNTERLEAMTRNDGLVALAVLTQSDARS